MTDQKRISRLFQKASLTEKLMTWIYSNPESILRDEIIRELTTCINKGFNDNPLKKLKEILSKIPDLRR